MEIVPRRAVSGPTMDVGHPGTTSGLGGGGVAQTDARHHADEQMVAPPRRTPAADRTNW